MNRTYHLLLTSLNLLLFTVVIPTFNHLTSMVYAQKLDTNNSDIIVSTPANLTKPNATTNAAASDTKPNATQTAATKTKVSKTPYEEAIAKLQPGGQVKYCYSFHSKFGSLGSGEGQFNRPHDIVFDSKGFLYINDRE